MYILRSIAISLILLTFFSQCKKNTEPTIVNVVLDDTISPPVPVIDGFPNEIGYNWTYYIFDTIKSFSDTMFVDVTDDTTIYNSQHLMIWDYSISSGEAFFRCVESNDTIGIYYSSQEDYIPGWPKILVRFPLFVGDSVGYEPDVMRKYAVVDYDTIELHNGDKYLAYEIDNIFTGLNDSFWDKFWYVEKIGIVRYEPHSMYGDGAIQELISYDFAVNP